MTISTADLLRLLDAQTTHIKQKQLCTLEVVRDNEFAFDVSIRIEMPKDQTEFVQMRHPLSNYTGKGINYGKAETRNTNT